MSRIVFESLKINLKTFPANNSTSFQRCLLVGTTSRRGTMKTTSNQRWNNVVFFNAGIYNLKSTLCVSTLIGTTFWQRSNNVIISKIEFQNVGNRRNNAVKMTISKKNKKKRKLCQIEYTDFEVLTTIL